MELKVPNKVYHYCSLDTFCKIINNKSLRMTNIQKSNDKLEIRYCYKSFKDTFIKACNDYSKNKEYEIAEVFNRIDFEYLLSKSILNESLIYYAVCFSEDNDLLSQWRAYSDNGKGVAIGFNTECFFNINETILPLLNNYAKIGSI